MQPDRTVRPFQLSDIPAINAISTVYFPESPRSDESFAHEERNRDPSQPFVQLVVEQADQIVAYATCGRDGAVSAPETFELWIVVAQDFAGQGIGRQLLARLQAFAREHGQRFVLSYCRETLPRSIHFLDAAGFAQIGKRFESALALDQFDETPFVSAFDQIAAHDITLTTLADERAPDAIERLYALAHPLLLSVPLPGGLIFDVPFDQWKALEIEHPDARPEALIIAKHGDEYVGYSNLWLPASGPAYTAMTGVLPAYRRRGIALALKLQTIRLARAHGYGEMRTNNDTANPGILALNERLGYQAQPAWLSWRANVADHG